MDCKKTNNDNRRRRTTNCVQCAILIKILSKLGIDIDTPASCRDVEDFSHLKNRKMVMRMLNISPSTYTRWKERGILVPQVFGGRDYYDDDGLKRALRESTRKGNR